MKLLLLGTTGYHPNDRRHTACLMIPEVGIILDAGTGIYRARNFLATRELDIFLTHAHLDHVIGLTFLFDVLRDKGVDRVTVHAAADKLQAIDEHLLAEALFPVKLPCEYRPIEGDVPLPGGGRLRSFPLRHPGGSLGFRLDWPGHSMAYVTDTTAEAGAAYIAEIAGVNVLVHECYYPDEYAEFAAMTGHSVTTPVAHVALAAGVGRLILVHVDPLSDAEDPVNVSKAQAVFPRTEVGTDLMAVDF